MVEKESEDQSSGKQDQTSVGRVGRTAGPESVLGDVTFLMMHSKTHRHLFLADMEWLVIPALRLKQMRVFRGKHGPLAYCSWAFLNEAAEKRLLSGQGRLAPRDWKSGTQPWIIDSITTAGSSQAFLKVLQEQVFRGQTVKLLRPRKDNQGWEGAVLADVLQNIKAKEIKIN
jgi:cytolysin-activating lysine-acyltransferase